MPSSHPNPILREFDVTFSLTSCRYPVYAHGGTADALADWLSLRSDHAGALLHPVLKSGRIVARRITPQSIYDLLARRATQAGVDDFSPHDLRRTCAGDLLDAGVDLVTVTAILGHASTNTTARYDRRGERAKQEAATALHLPYRRRTSPKGREAVQFI